MVYEYPFGVEEYFRRSSVGEIDDLHIQPEETVVEVLPEIYDALGHEGRVILASLGTVGLLGSNSHYENASVIIRLTGKDDKILHRQRRRTALASQASIISKRRASRMYLSENLNTPNKRGIDLFDVVQRTRLWRTRPKVRRARKTTCVCGESRNFLWITNLNSRF